MMMMFLTIWGDTSGGNPLGVKKQKSPLLVTLLAIAERRQASAGGRAMADFIYDDLEPANIAAAQVLIAAERA